MREYRPPGSVRGASGNRRPYLDKVEIEGWRGAFLPGRLAQAGSPFNGFAEVGELCGDVGADGCLQRDYVVQNPEGVFAHFFAGEKLGQGRGEVQARLERVGWDSDAELS